MKPRYKYQDGMAILRTEWYGSFTVPAGPIYVPLSYQAQKRFRMAMEHAERVVRKSQENFKTMLLREEEKHWTRA